MNKIALILSLFLATNALADTDPVGNSYTDSQIYEQIQVADNGTPGLYLFPILATVTPVTSHYTATQILNQSLRENVATHQRGLAVYIEGASGEIASCPLLMICNGSAGAPSYSFFGDDDTGIYLNVPGGGASPILSFAIDGVTIYEVSQDSLLNSGYVTVLSPDAAVSGMLLAAPGGIVVSAQQLVEGVDAVPMLITAGAPIPGNDTALAGADVTLAAAPGVDGNVTHELKDGGDVILSPASGVNGGENGAVKISINGSASSPALSFVSEPYTGLYASVSGDAQILGLAASGVPGMELSQDVNAGLGSTTFLEPQGEAVVVISPQDPESTIYAAHNTNDSKTNAVALKIYSMTAIAEEGSQAGADVTLEASDAIDGSDTHTAKVGGDIVLNPGTGVNTGLDGIVQLGGVTNITVGGSAALPALRLNDTDTGFYVPAFLGGIGMSVNAQSILESYEFFGTLNVNIGGSNVDAISFATAGGTAFSIDSDANININSDTYAPAFISGVFRGLASETGAAGSATVYFKADLSQQQDYTAAGQDAYLQASDALPGSITDGAAGGGDAVVQGGNANRLTSGNAAGGDVKLLVGTGIGTGSNGNVIVSLLPVYADNAAAVAGGLPVGSLYRTGADPDPVMIVH